MQVERQVPFPIIRALVETYYDFQSQRITTQSRIKNNADSNQISEEQLAYFGVSPLFKKAESFENDIKKLLRTYIPQYPIYNTWLSDLYGIGPVITGGLIAYIETPTRFKHITNLWEYSGLGMNTWCDKCEGPTWVETEISKKDGTITKAKRLRPFKMCPRCGNQTRPIIQKRMSGYMSNWNDKFKVLCWKIGESFVKQGQKSSYYGLYLRVKKEYREQHPEIIKVDNRTQYNDGHIHNMAIRKVVKIFLSHLIIQWYVSEGQPPPSTYIKAIMGHDEIPPFKDGKKNKKQIKEADTPEE